MQLIKSTQCTVTNNRGTYSVRESKFFLFSLNLFEQIVHCMDESAVHELVYVCVCDTKDETKRNWERQKAERVRQAETTN